MYASLEMRQDGDAEIGNTRYEREDGKIRSVDTEIGATRGSRIVRRPVVFSCSRPASNVSEDRRYAGEKATFDYRDIV